VTSLAAAARADRPALTAAAGDDEELAECVANLKAGPILG
jgi:hypothetical protein